MTDAINIAKKFKLIGEIDSVVSHGSGNVNDTFLISMKNNERYYILQRVNTYVFKDPKVVMRNMRIATAHIANRASHQSAKWKIQEVIHSYDEQDYWIANDNSFWRVISYIDNSESFDIVDTHKKAYELGAALGYFHELISDLPHEALLYSIDGFHISPQYLDAYDFALKRTGVDIVPLMDFAFDFIEYNRHHIDVLEKAKDQGILPLRIMHGDPKANNVMFDKDTGSAISMIDLDTVQPGLIHYDIGDCMRSSCNPLGEEPGARRWQETYFDLESFEYLLKGYLSKTKTFLKSAEYDYIYDSIFLMTFELGLRFFTDYLNGDAYYKIHYSEQNLYRGLTQFKLAQSIQQNREKIIKIVDHLK